MAHPTQNKERLMNKILAQMMINCRENVKGEQVTELIKYKKHAADFDWTDPEYRPLLNFDLDRYKVDESLP